MESFVERFRAKASKARQAQSRLKALERMQRIAPAHVDSPFEFSLREPAKLPRPLLAIENQAPATGTAVLEHVKLHDRAGRSHGAPRPERRRQIDADEATGRRAGRARRARAPRRAICSSAISRSISSSSSRRRNRPLQQSARIGGGARQASTEQELRDYLAGFGFRGDRVFEPVEPFSGGEKARLVLALVTYLRPNLLLLDEPTNHLDLEMRQALERRAAGITPARWCWCRTTGICSHRGRRVLIVVHDGRARYLRRRPGRLRQVACHRRPGACDQQRRAAESPVPVQAPAAVSESAEQRKQRRREEAAHRNRLGPLRASVQKQELKLEQLSANAPNSSVRLAPRIFTFPPPARNSRSCSSDKKNSSSKAPRPRQRGLKRAPAWKRPARNPRRERQPRYDRFSGGVSSCTARPARSARWCSPR